MAYLNRTTLMDSNNNVYDSVKDVHGDYHMGVAVIQDNSNDTNNQSTANLSSGATFTGTGTSIPGVAIINVMLYADQNCTVYVDQSGDGTNYDISDTYYYVASVGGFSVPAQVAGVSYRVRVTNTGASSTTVLRLYTLLASAGSPLPRSLDPYQNLKVGVYELSDQYGFIGTFDPQGRLAVQEPTRLVGNLFTATVDTAFWTVANSGAGSVADTGATTPNYATFSSGTANSGYGKISSVRLCWFLPSVPLKFHSYATLTTVIVANTTRAWGAMNLSTVAPQDGFFFSVNGSGALSVNCANAGSVTSVASGSFNGLVSKVALDTNQHHYDIMFGIFGAYFFMDGILIHNMKQTTAPLTSTYTLTAAAYSSNSASGTASATLQLGMLAISRLGKLESAPKSFFTSSTSSGTVLKNGPGILHTINLTNFADSTVVTIYDNVAASGTVIWTYTCSAENPGNIPPTTVNVEIPFFLGLTVVISTAAMGFGVTYE